MTVEPRVLVVDDEPAIRALVAKIIERAGLPVDSAHDGAVAIEKLNERSYAVLVLDLMMPNVDGYTLLDFLGRQPGIKPAVIVISAADSGAMRGLDGSVVHSIVRKPFDIDVLGDLVTAAARTRAAAAEETAPAKDEGGEVVPFRSAC